MGILKRISRKIRSILRDRKIDRAHFLHKRNHEEEYEYIDAIIDRYREGGGLRHRFQAYKLFKLRELLLECMAESILELGTGTTTAIFCDYIRKSCPYGKLYCIDESEHWLNNSKRIANVRGEEKFQFIYAPKKIILDQDPVEIKYDIELNEKFDLVFIDGPSLRSDGRKIRNAINSNIFDIASFYLPDRIVIDIREQTVNAVIQRLGDYYTYHISDLIKKNIRYNYNYLSVFQRKDTSSK